MRQRPQKRLLLVIVCAVLLGITGRARRRSNRRDDHGAVQKQKKKRQQASQPTHPSSRHAADRSAVCAPHFGNFGINRRIQRIFFAHTRKAGGTFVKALLRRAAERYNLIFDHVEGDPVEEPRQSNTFYVTNIRHPVERAISNYKYEGRWHCRKLIFPQRYNNYVPTAENAVSLQDYMDTRDPPRCPVLPTKQRKILWRCMESCYMRWFGQDFDCLQNVTRNYDTALHNLQKRFHLVVVVSWIKKYPDYWQNLLSMLGLDDEELSPDFDKRKLYCATESQHWNRVYPAPMPNATLRDLEQRNALDTALYNRITDCGSKGVAFPRNVSLGQLVAPRTKT